MTLHKLVGFRPATPDNFGGLQDDANVFTYLVPVIDVFGLLFSPNRPDWEDKHLETDSGIDCTFFSEASFINTGENLSFAGKTFLNDIVFTATTAGFEASLTTAEFSAWNKVKNGFFIPESYPDFVSSTTSLMNDLDAWALKNVEYGDTRERFAYQAWGLYCRIYAPWGSVQMERKIQLLDVLGHGSTADVLRSHNG